jgi:hypothetical protein
VKRSVLLSLVFTVLTAVCQFAAAGGRIWFVYKESPSVFLEQAIALLPAESRVTEIDSDHPLAKRIDQQVLRILKTTTGRKFCEVVSENVQSVERTFFIRHEAAVQAMEVCRGSFTTKFARFAFRKRFFLADVDFQASGFGEYRMVDGWTTPRNETIIFAKEDELTDDRLLRTLAHEMAVSYDAKEQIGFGGILDYPRLGLIASESSCLAQQLVRLPHLKHSLSAIRAFTVEGAIARELSVSLPEGFANWTKLSCADRLRFMKPYSEAWQEALAYESLVSFLIDRPLYCPVMPVHGLDLELAAETLSQLTFAFADGRRVNACEYLTEGLPLVPGISLHGGPGPRVTGGWRQLQER